MLEKFNKQQVEKISDFFADLAKILFGSSVVGFFVPDFAGKVTLAAFIIGSVFSISFFAFSVIVLKQE